MRWRIRLASSARIHDGKLYLSLKDAIELALENNLDIGDRALQPSRSPILTSCALKAGGVFRGRQYRRRARDYRWRSRRFGTGAPGAGAGGTTGGAGGAGGGAWRTGAIHSWRGHRVSSFDPTLSAVFGEEHQTLPLQNLQVTVYLPCKPISASSMSITLKAFPRARLLSFTFQNGRQRDE